MEASYTVEERFFTAAATPECALPDRAPGVRGQSVSGQVREVDVAGVGLPVTPH